MRHLIIFVVFTLFSCSQDQNDPKSDALGHFYFPLNLNDFWIYQVEEKIYNDNGIITQQHYQLLYEVMDKNTKDNVTTYQIQVRKRMDGQASWKDTLLYLAYKNEYTAVLNTGSASFVKLSFPAYLDKQWNGNALNSLPEDTYRIDSIDHLFTINDITFENTMTVTQEHSIDPIQITSDIIMQEVYAYNIGLVYQEETIITYKSCGSIYPECCGDNNINVCFGEIDEGYSTIKYLIAHEVNL